MFSEQILSDLLTSDKPEMRCIGRLVSTGIPQKFQDFINSEIERNTHPGDVQFALLKIVSAYMIYLLLNLRVGLDFPRDPIVTAFALILESDFQKMGKVLEQNT